MKRRNLYIGPGAASLLMVIVVVSMSVLGLLALMSARSDEKLMQRNRDFVTAEYETSANAERSLAQLDDLAADCAIIASSDEAYLALVERELPDGMEMSGREISWTEISTLGRGLHCVVELAELGAQPRLAWREHMFISESEDAFFE